MAANSARYPNHLRKLIKQAGLTVKEVAEDSGIPLRTLFEYCKGDIPVPRKKLEDIATVIGCPPHQLIPPIPQMGLNLLQSTSEQANYWVSTSFCR